MCIIGPYGWPEYFVNVHYRSILKDDPSASLSLTGTRAGYRTTGTKVLEGRVMSNWRDSIKTLFLLYENSLLAVGGYDDHEQESSAWGKWCVGRFSKGL